VCLYTVVLLDLDTLYCEVAGSNCLSFLTVRLLHIYLPLAYESVSTPDVISGSHIDDVLRVDNAGCSTSLRNSVYTRLKGTNRLINGYECPELKSAFFACVIRISDVSRYAIIRKLLNSIFNMRWETLQTLRGCC
jgi:hypothetical protein